MKNLLTLISSDVGGTAVIDACGVCDGGGIEQLCGCGTRYLPDCSGFHITPVDVCSHIPR